MDFQNRLEIVQKMFTNKQVRISGGITDTAETTCLEVRHTENDQIDFICENKSTYGMRLSQEAIITETSVSDSTPTISQFIRTVEVLNA